MKKLQLRDLNEFLARVSQNRALYLPAERAGVVNWARYGADANVRLEALNTALPAKELFFPQCENLIDFTLNGQKLTITPRALQEEPFVAFGVRACDLRGLEVLDRVFLSEPADPFYQARRAHGLIVTLACANPDKTCFCKAFGIDAADPAGDVAAWLIGEELYLRAASDKGEEFLKEADELLQEADEEAVATEQARVRAAIDQLPYSALELPAYGEEELKKHFDSPIWAELSEACLGCGGCTFACPTCQCYDIRDFDTGHGVERYRCWDSCMYSDFTMMAHGTPRPTRRERFRQRFMHKLVYFPMNNEGLYGCVGCGRCVRKCPVSLHIVKVAKALRRAQDV